MKIAIYSGAIPSATFIEHLIKGISQTEQVILFGTLNKKVFKPYLSENISIHHNEVNKFKNVLLTTYRLIKLSIFYPSRLLPLLSELSRYSRAYNKWVYLSKFVPMVLYKPDILHIQWAKDIQHYAFLKNAYGIKIILSLLGSHINYSPIANKQLAAEYRKWFPKLDAFHAVSEAIKIEAQKYNAILNKTVVIRSPIPELFFDAYKPFVIERNQNFIKLVSVGRFHWVKGITYAVHAVAILKQRGYNVCYTIIGGETPSEEILFLIEDLGLQNDIHLIPGIDQELLIELLKNQNIFILPSIMEGIANVVLEAMAIGLPVLSTDCGGMSEVVKTSETGWLLPKRSASAIADGVENIIATKEDELHSITKNAHNLVKRFYSANNSIDEFSKLYHDVVNNNFKVV